MVCLLPRRGRCFRNGTWMLGPGARSVGESGAFPGFEIAPLGARVAWSQDELVIAFFEQLGTPEVERSTAGSEKSSKAF